MNIEFSTFLKREIYRFMVLYKQTIVPALISSLLYIIVFGSTLGSRIDSISGVPYINYIIPGLVMMSVITQAYQNSASSIMQAKYLKFIEDILIAPLSGLQISLGYIIGGTIRGMMCGLGILIMCLFITDLQIINLPLTIFYLLTVSWTFSAFGVIIGIVAKSWDEIGSCTNFVFMPMTFLGGVFYSIDDLPEIFRIISQFNPLYWMINGLRYSTVGISDSSPMISMYISIIFAFIFTYAASIMFSKGYRIKE